jgi:hypothetical protein
MQFILRGAARPPLAAGRDVAPIFATRLTRYEFARFQECRGRSCAGMGGSPAATFAGNLRLELGARRMMPGRGTRARPDRDAAAADLIQ